MLVLTKYGKLCYEILGLNKQVLVNTLLSDDFLVLVIAVRSFPTRLHHTKKGKISFHSSFRSQVEKGNG